MKNIGNILVYIVIALFMLAYLGTMGVLGYNAMISENVTERVSCFFALLITNVLVSAILLVYVKFNGE